MPKVIGFTPAWLTRPNAGYDMFTPKTASTEKASSGPQRTIATRGSEVFTAVGREIRWADLSRLKEALEGTPNLSASRSRRLATPPVKASYRTLKVSIPLPITQLVMSPYGDYMAVATSHTVHVVTLPDSSLLETDDTEPLKQKTFQIGPTTHVREESPVASVLWHPLGYRGHCLVTITKEAVVRLWELNRTDRMSFSEPALSVDLKKLANAEDDTENVTASKYGARKGFSPDSVELEVTSACFSGLPEQEGIHGWAPMTLWIAMREGYVHALCPLLPSKWQLLESAGASTFMGTLATSIHAYCGDIDHNPHANAEDKETSRKQLSWLMDFTDRDPFHEATLTGESVTIYTRPNSVPAYPLLQGPFSITSDIDEFELSDLTVFSLKTFSDGTDEEAAEGIPAAVLCLLTATSQVHICLDLEGIVGRWLPSPDSEWDVSDSEREHTLVHAETIALGNNDTPSFQQTITQDEHTDFTFFVTNASGVFYISAEPWVRRLEDEISMPQPDGVEFRLNRLLESFFTRAEKVIPRPASATADDVTSCVVIENGNIGYLVLTTYGHEPCAVLLDAPEDGFYSPDEVDEALGDTDVPTEPRHLYAPPKELYEDVNPHNALSRISARHRATFSDEIRLSPANLELMMEVHSHLSQATKRMLTAVSELYRKCESLQDQFRDQIYRTSDTAKKIEAAIGLGEDASEDGFDDGININDKVAQRVERVKERQRRLNARYETLKSRMTSVGSTELSELETDWFDELQTIDRSVNKQQQNLTDDIDGNEVPASERLEKLQALKKSLSQQAARAAKQTNSTDRNGVKVPSHSRKQENQQVQMLLDRESALVDAAANRLRSLGISIPLEH
ncbi:hypothetical protein P154DRAFT_427758 [Amniculicola lignicola CBS 123094]|uniref:Uncharacterized protein n=1 Tax=Amniculicola lignicola CBS 123094 TaxID=1392246 RepID=A0A6A5WQG4_9PLEO|nr:hypothetical protein P154DRAFT_427758 [Amniculicola lignicola CBS 123094]